MAMRSIFDHLKVLMIEPNDSAYTIAAGTDVSAVLSEYVDTLGYEDVTLILLRGTVVSGGITAIKVAQCDTSGGSYADIAGTAQTATDKSNQMMGVHIHRPQERFVKLSHQRTVANTTILAAVAILSQPHQKAVTQSTATAGGFTATPETFNAPGEGTA